MRDLKKRATHAHPNFKGLSPRKSGASQFRDSLTSSVHRISWLMCHWQACLSKVLIKSYFSLSLFLNESLCRTFYMKTSLLCMKLDVGADDSHFYMNDSTRRLVSLVLTRRQTQLVYGLLLCLINSQLESTRISVQLRVSRGNLSAQISNVSLAAGE